MSPIAEALLAVLLLGGPTVAWVIYRRIRSPEYGRQRWAPQSGAPAALPIGLSGEMSQRTAAFEMAGDYLVTWAIAARGHEPGHVGAFLEPIDGGQGYPLAIGVAPPGKLAGDELEIEGLPPGRYYLQIAANCRWTINLRPR